jgi:hypothetical protein
MASMHKLSDQLIDYAERMSDVADAAQGKRRRRGFLTSRWFVLPAAGAGLWALVRSDSFSRQAREVVDDAKSRASELPDDLVRRVRQTTRSTSTRGRSTTTNGSGSRAQGATGARTTTRKRRAPRAKSSTR